MQFGRVRVPFPSRWFQGRFSVVFLLILTTVIASLLQWCVEFFSPEWPATYFALSRTGVEHGFYWQFLSYMFLHGSVLHLLFNCLGLYFAGREVEIICGPRHLLGVYFAGGILGGIVQLIAGPVETVLLGASAGVCAVLLAYCTIMPEMEVTLLLYFVIPVPMRAKWLGRILITVSLFFGAIIWLPPFQGFLASLDRNGSMAFFVGQVGHLAHLGGAMTGWFYARRLGFGGTFWLVSLFRERRRLRERRARMNPEQFISEEIDPILDKISREGIHSLTRAERRVLELGRDKIARKTTPFK